MAPAVQLPTLEGLIRLEASGTGIPSIDRLAVPLGAFDLFAGNSVKFIESWHVWFSHISPNGY